MVEELVKLHSGMISATSLRVIGKPLDDVVGKKFWDTPWFTATTGVPQIIRDTVTAAGKGEAVREEISLQLPSGVRSFDFSIRPIRGTDGEVVAIVPEAVDITERRLAEEYLRQSQKLEAMGQLTGGVAHDFNSLLTPIIGSLDMLLRSGVGSERERRLMNGGKKSAERARTLVQRLLAFSRRQPLQVELVDIAGLIAGMAELLAGTLGTRIKLVVESAGDLPSAKAYANQLEMAILNLIVNARDAMPDGGSLRIAVVRKSSALATGPASRQRSISASV